MSRRKNRIHSWFTQVLPLHANIVACQHCGATTRIGEWPTGKRAKCVKGRKYSYPTKIAHRLEKYTTREAYLKKYYGDYL